MMHSGLLHGDGAGELISRSVGDCSIDFMNGDRVNTAVEQWVDMRGHQLLAAGVEVVKPV